MSTTRNAAGPRMRPHHHRDVELPRFIGALHQVVDRERRDRGVTDRVDLVLLGKGGECQEGEDEQRTSHCGSLSVWTRKPAAACPISTSGSGSSRRWPGSEHPQQWSARRPRRARTGATPVPSKSNRPPPKPRIADRRALARARIGNRGRGRARRRRVLSEIRVRERVDRAGGAHRHRHRDRSRAPGVERAISFAWLLLLFFQHTESRVRRRALPLHLGGVADVLADR